MKKELKGIDDETFVHCSTEELANQVLKIAHEAGYTWSCGESYQSNNLWNNCKDRMCYALIKGFYSSLNYNTSKSYKIITAEDFIKLNTKFVLPEKWCVKLDRNNIGVLSKWRGNSNLYNGDVFGFLQADKIWKSTVGEEFIEITFEQFKKYVLKEEETMETTYKVPREALKEIYYNLCGGWQSTVRGYLYSDLFSNTVEVTKVDVEEAYKEATTTVQKEWLAKYLPKPKKLVTKEVSGWLNVYHSENHAYYNTKEAADYGAGTSRIACVEVKGTYQIEE